MSKIIIIGSGIGGLATAKLVTMFMSTRKKPAQVAELGNLKKMASPSTPGRRGI